MAEHQQCVRCGERTGRCEEDALYVEGSLATAWIGPLCEECFDNSDTPAKPPEVTRGV